MNVPSARLWLRGETKSKDKRPNGIVRYTLPTCIDGDCRRDDLAICRSDSKLRPTGSRIRSGVRVGCSGDSDVSGGQASKGIRWMPWLQEAMKDVVKLR